MLDADEFDDVDAPRLICGFERMDSDWICVRANNHTGSHVFRERLYETEGLDG